MSPVNANAEMTPLNNEISCLFLLFLLTVLFYEESRKFSFFQCILLTNRSEVLSQYVKYHV